MRLNPRSSTVRTFAFVALAMPLFAWTGLAQATDSDSNSAKKVANPVPSLDIVPDDVAFYSATLRNREQWDAMVNSKAWNKLKEMPLVQMGLGLYSIQAADPTSVPGKIQTALRTPELRKPLDLIVDMMSDEVFTYGGHGVTEMMQLMQEVNKAQQFAPLSSLMKEIDKSDDEKKGDEKAGDEKSEPGLAQAKAMLSLLASHTDKIKIPEFVMGFHVKNQGLAKEMLERLYDAGSAAANDQPLLNGRMKKETVDGHEYITINADGSMIPWEDANLGDIRAKCGNPEEFDKLVEHMKAMKLVVSLGLREDYIILAVGPSTDVLTHIGHGSTLKNRKEFAPLARHAHKPLLSIGYVSAAFQRSAAMNKEDIDQLPAQMKSMLPSLKVPAAMRHDLMSDMGKLAQDIKALVPEVGATMAFSYRVDGGQEGFVYDWTQHGELDSSKPLSLLQHIGGSPIAALVARSKYNPAAYADLKKWVGVAYGYFEKYGLPKMKDSDQTEFKDFAAKILPLVKRASDVTQEKLIPALSDGQTGLVLDAKLMSKQFVASLPETPKEMPMIEPAIVLGVSNAAMLRKAMEQYYDIADEAVEAIRTLKDAKIPADFKLMRPTETTTSTGSIYSFAIPETCGVDSQVLPNAALNEHVAVLSLSKKHSERLLATTDPAMAGRVIPYKTPLAGASGFDFAAMIEAATPWVDYGLEVGMKDSKGGPFDLDSVREQVHTVLDVLKVFRGAVSVTYFEDKALVSRWHSEMHDVAE